MGQFAKELKCKCRVLKKLEYLSEENCAVLSMFIMDRPSKKQKSSKHQKVAYPVPIIVHNAYEQILVKARSVLLIKKECGLSEEFGLFDNIGFKDEDDYISSFCPDLIKPIFQWVNGADFAEVNKLTPLFE